MLWQQATVFTERWWVPKGWSLHWKAIEMAPIGLWEFQTLADCQLAQTQAMSRRRRSSTSEGQARQQIRLRASRLATKEDRAWRTVEVNSKRLIAVIVFSWILAFATSASAERA
jgi:hypothetical protein